MSAHKESSGSPDLAVSDVSHENQRKGFQDAFAASAAEAVGCRKSRRIRIEKDAFDFALSFSVRNNQSSTIKLSVRI
jgi:hypothetical protein